MACFNRSDLSGQQNEQSDRLHVELIWIVLLYLFVLLQLFFVLPARQLVVVVFRLALLKLAYLTALTRVGEDVA